MLLSTSNFKDTIDFETQDLLDLHQHQNLQMRVLFSRKKPHYPISITYKKPQNPFWISGQVVSWTSVALINWKDMYLVCFLLFLFRNNVLEAFDNQIELKLSVQFFKKSGKIFSLYKFKIPKIALRFRCSILVPTWHNSYPEWKWKSYPLFAFI